MSATFSFLHGRGSLNTSLPIPFCPMYIYKAQEPSPAAAHMLIGQCDGNFSGVITIAALTLGRNIGFERWYDDLPDTP